MRRDKGEMERALDELWQRARFRLYSPRHLWTWLDLNRRFELSFVRSGQLKVQVPRGLVPDCDSCLEICCTGPNAVVSLRLRDIAALVDAGLEEHITFDRPDAPGDRSWAALEASWSVFHRTFPVLRRDETGTCALLTDERTCGAWPSWPLSCARYPYAIDVLGRRIFLAKGCGEHRFVTLEDPPGRVRDLVDAAVKSYNERVKDIILLHVALDELCDLGLARFLCLDGRLGRKAERRLAASAAAGDASVEDA